MKRIAFHNLGCKVNSYELDIMRQKTEEAGYISVPFEDEADVYVINTCTVTNIADRKSRQMIHKAKKRNPDAVVIAVGCYVETDPERVGTDPAIDLAIGNNNKGRIAELLDDFLAERAKITGPACGRRSQPGPAVGEAEAARSQPGPVINGEDALAKRTLGGRTMSDLTHRPEYEDMLLEDPGHTRAYVKIQDGCNQFCTYCIIPYARGRIRSRRPGEVLREIGTIAQKGIREVVLTGIHVSSYGLEWDAQTQGGSGQSGSGQSGSGQSGSGQSDSDLEAKMQAVRFDPHKSGAILLDLMEKIRQIPGIERIRLSSLEPRIMTEAFVKGIAAMPEVCPHFHLSLQSGCNTTLRRMNRHYTTEEFMGSVKLLRQYYEDPAVTTDVIVGFPGESEAEFAETVKFLEEVNFYEMHVFKYSVRKGTVAAKMPVQIPEPVKGVRSDILLEMTERQSAAFRSKFIGREEELLLEEKVQMPFGLCWRGHTKRYVEGYILCDEESGAGPTSGENASGETAFGGRASGETASGGPLSDEPAKILYEPGQLVRGTFTQSAEDAPGLIFSPNR